MNEQLHKRNQKLMEQGFQKNKKLEGLKSLSILEKALEESKFKINQLQKHLQKKNQRISYLENQQKNSIEQRKLLKDQKKEFQEERKTWILNKQNLQTRIQELQEKIKRKQAELRQTKSQLDSQKRIRSDLDVEKNNFKKHQTENDKIIAQLKDKLQIKTTQNSQQKRLIILHQKQISQLKEQLETQVMLNRVKQQQQQNLKQKGIGMNDKLRFYQQSLSKKNQQMKFLSNQYNKYKEQASAKLNYFNNFQQIIKNYQKLCQEGKVLMILQKQLDKNNQQRSEMLTSLRNQQFEHKKLQDNFSQVKNALIKQVQKNKVLWNDNKLLKQKSNSLQQKVRQASANSQLLGKQLQKTIKEWSQKYSNDIEQKNKKIEQTKQQLNHYKFNLTKSQDFTSKKIQTLEENLDSLSQRLLESQKARDALQNDITSSTIQLSNNYKKITQLQIRLKNLVSDYDEISKELQQSKEKGQFYKARNSQIQRLKQKNQKSFVLQINQLKKSLQNSQQKTKLLLSKNQKELDSNLSQLDLMKDHLQRYKRQNNVLKEHQEQIKNDLNLYRNRMNTLQQEKIKLVRNIQKLEGEKTQLNLRLDKRVVLHYQKQEAQLAAKKQLQQKYRNLKKVLEDIQSAIVRSSYQTNAKNTLKCSYCMDKLKKAIKLYPCGHLYCESCKDGYRPSCSVCKIKQLNIFRDQISDRAYSLISIMQTKVGMFHDQLNNF